jgi:hypothetical protein
MVGNLVRWLQTIPRFTKHSAPIRVTANFQNIVRVNPEMRSELKGAIAFL